MQHTVTQKYISGLIVSALLLSPLSASAMWLSDAKKQLICQERALVATERQVESIERLINTTDKRIDKLVNQFNEDMDFVMTYPDQVMKLIEDIGTNYASIISGNITLDMAGLKAVISMLRNAIRIVSKIQKFITRTQQVIKRWQDMDKTLKREVNMFKAYVNSIKNMSYTKTLQRCMKW